MFDRSVKIKKTNKWNKQLYLKLRVECWWQFSYTSTLLDCIIEFDYSLYQQPISYCFYQIESLQGSLVDPTLFLGYHPQLWYQYLHSPANVEFDCYLKYERKSNEISTPVLFLLMYSKSEYSLESISVSDRSHDNSLKIWTNSDEILCIESSYRYLERVRRWEWLLETFLSYSKNTYSSRFL